MKKRHILAIIFQLFIFNGFAQQVVSGDVQNGTGTYQYSEGSVYEGQWKNGDTPRFRQNDLCQENQ